MCLYQIQISNIYVYICNNINNNPDINKHLSKTNFLYIEYLNNITKENAELFLNHEYYISGNQLFSPAFVYKMLKNRSQSHLFNMDYTIYLLDKNINRIELHNDQFIQLHAKTYEIKTR